MDTKIPTSTPRAKHPKITRTLDTESFHVKNFTSVTSAFCNENITTTVINSKAIKVLNFIVISINQCSLIF